MENDTRCVTIAYTRRIPVLLFSHCCLVYLLICPTGRNMYFYLVQRLDIPIDFTCEEPVVQPFFLIFIYLRNIDGSGVKNVQVKTDFIRIEPVADSIFSIRIVTCTATTYIRMHRGSLNHCSPQFLIIF